MFAGGIKLLLCRLALGVVLSVGRVSTSQEGWYVYTPEESRSLGISRNGKTHKTYCLGFNGQARGRLPPLFLYRPPASSCRSAPASDAQLEIYRRMRGCPNGDSGSQWEEYMNHSWSRNIRRAGKRTASRFWFCCFKGGAELQSARA